MEKIPTLFIRDPNDRRHVLQDVTPGCEWALAGEGRPTRKFDGTCVLIRRDRILMVHAYARREVKPGKDRPPRFVELAHDDVTGKTIGWEPYDQSSFAKFIDEALDSQPDIAPGTYELCGPKINKNPEGFERHELIKHGEQTIGDVLDSYSTVRDYVLSHPEYEGVVWWHPDGRKAKIKRRDFTS